MSPPALVPAGQQVRGAIITREDAVLCGCTWAEETFRRLDPRVRLDWHAGDGGRLAAGQVICEISGPARAVLSGERTALNFLQLLSATATEARRFVDAVAGTGCRILDTRKTLPGLRTAQKYAVRCGGADNHRMGLYDRVLIKENHIVAAGTIGAAIAAARSGAPGIPVEVEVETLGELREALDARPEVIMLDEFSLHDMRSAVALNRQHGARRQARGLRRRVARDGARDRRDRCRLRVGRRSHQARASGRPVDAAKLRRRLNRCCGQDGTSIHTGRKVRHET